METNRTQLYNPAETDRIVKALRESPLVPEYVLLFGTLAGGTPHSDVLAYDLLAVVRRATEYDWLHAKRYLNNKIPRKSREIPYVNIYVMTLEEVETRRTPFLHFALTEGKELYSNDRAQIRRPRKAQNFGAAYRDAKLYHDMFLSLGNRFLEQAQEAAGYHTDDRIRMAAHAAAQAARQYYRVLYYVYHNQEFEAEDLRISDERMRTLSTELKLLYEDTHTDHVTTLPRLREYEEKACRDLGFAANPCMLEQDIERVERMGQIVEKACRRRLEIYREKMENPGS